MKTRRETIADVFSKTYKTVTVHDRDADEEGEIGKSLICQDVQTADHQQGLPRSLHITRTQS